MASYGRPRFLDALRGCVRARRRRRLRTEPVDWRAFAPALAGGDGWTRRRTPTSPRACSGGWRRCCSSWPRWLHERTGESRLAMAGGVALNCVANSRLCADGPVRRGVGAAGGGRCRHGAGRGAAGRRRRRPRAARCATAALGREWDEEELRGWLPAAGVAFERPDDVAEVVAEALAHDGDRRVVPGPLRVRPARAGSSHRCSPTRGAPRTSERLNDVKGREQFRPVAPMVLEERAAEIFAGRLPSPHMLFTHEVADEWRERIPAVVHVDGTARIQTVTRRGGAADGRRCCARSRRAPACRSSSTRR